MFGLNYELEKLESDGTPIRTSIIGTGVQGAGFAEGMELAPGMRVNIACDISIEKAIEAYLRSGVSESQIEVCNTIDEAEKAIKAGKRVVTNNYRIACQSENVDVVCESTGNPDLYVLAGIEAINNGKHFIAMGIEGDVCVGHIMNQWARNAGVVYSGVYGDEPGQALTLYAEAKALGFEVLTIGRSDMGGSQLKWNKETVVEELAKMGRTYGNPTMYASFLDGSKTNEECCTIANATGFRPDIRGMRGECIPFSEFIQRVPVILKPKSEGGILDHYRVVERVRVPGDPIAGTSHQFIWVFVTVRCVTSGHREMMLATKGIVEGDCGILWAPYHLGGAQAPITVASAFLDHRATIMPLPGMKRAADVATMAKSDIKKGMIIDEIGGYLSTGRIECASIVRAEKLLPLALARGTKVLRDVQQGEFLTYDDVEFTEKPTLLHKVRMLQDELYGDLH